ncbi:MAG: DUF5717 family protein [Lachnospiraceae bacterium]|nr:DUF5717 family protein [Lachnospiraceae bacterium]
MSLSVDVKKIEGTCRVGGIVTGSFTLYDQNTDHIAFMIRTTQRRIEIDAKNYNGLINEDGIKINYSINTFGLDQGTVFKGSISIISNRGEKRLPVIISVIRDEISSSQGPVRNLFHFTNLARENFSEAVNIFYTDEMARIFSDGDRDTYFKYRAFKGCTHSESARYTGVEEFLIETNKKTPVLLSFAESNVMAQNVSADQNVSITVKKSGWGFPGFEIESTDDFIELPKKIYGIDDFEGIFAEVRLIIKADRLHMGHNFGSVILKSLHTEITIPVFVDMPYKDKSIMEKNILRQNVTAKLMNEFISFRIGDLNGSEWIEHSTRQLERILIEDRHDVEARLMQSQLLLAANRYGEADSVLSVVERDLENSEELSYDIIAYLIYLKAMSSRDENELKKAVRQVWDLYDRDRSSWRVLWILIYLDESIKLSPEREKKLIEEQISYGVNSPLIYLEAYSILSHDPSVIKNLTDFELNVLNFAIKRGLLKKEIAEVVCLLSQRMRGFDKRLIRIMRAYYDEFNDNEMLTAICSYIIRNGITDKIYFRFFKEAVSRNIAVTNLYDYYLYTMDHKTAELLPKNVLMYYGMQNDLPADLKSYVYANMIVNETEAETYLSQSREACAYFAATEVLSGHMNENIAIIVDYLKFFRGMGIVDTKLKEIDKAIVENGYVRLITITDPRIRSLVVIEGAFKEERVIPVYNGTAYVSIYDADYSLFFEDAFGKRYGSQYVRCEDIRLLRLHEFLNTIRYPDTDVPGVWVALSERGQNGINIDDRNVKYVRRIAESDLFTETFKNDLFVALIRFYYDNDMQDELYSLLMHTDVSNLTMKERNEYVRFCSMRADDREALEVLEKYGSYETDPKVLMRISTRYIEAGKEITPTILEITDATFRGNKYNELILDVMSRYFEGTLRELKEIWKACRDFEADPTIIEGRIIEQLLETGAYIGERDEIFFDYIRKDASKRVVSAYFRRAAEEDFLRDTVTDDRLFIGLLDYAIDEEITDIEALSLIRFFSKRRDLRSDKILIPHIKDLAERDIVFEFFRDYRDALPELKLFDEDVFIDFRGEPGSRVELNYIIEQGDKDEVSYKVEPMRELFEGVYQTRSLVFPGESLQYYITENGRDGGDAMRSGEERSEEQLTNGDHRYDILQDALTSYNMGDMDSFEELISDYMIKDRIVREILWEES